MRNKERRLFAGTASPLYRASCISLIAITTAFNEDEYALLERNSRGKTWELPVSIQKRRKRQDSRPDRTPHIAACSAAGLSAMMDGSWPGSTGGPTQVNDANYVASGRNLLERSCLGN